MFCWVCIYQINKYQLGSAMCGLYTTTYYNNQLLLFLLVLELCLVIPYTGCNNTVFCVFHGALLCFNQFHHPKFHCYHHKKSFYVLKLKLVIQIGPRVLLVPLYTSSPYPFTHPSQFIQVSSQ